MTGGGDCTTRKRGGKRGYGKQKKRRGYKRETGTAAQLHNVPDSRSICVGPARPAHVTSPENRKFYKT